jgi:hypothetical protein
MREPLPSLKKEIFTVHLQAPAGGEDPKEENDQKGL